LAHYVLAFYLQKDKASCLYNLAVLQFSPAARKKIQFDLGILKRNIYVIKVNRSNMRRTKYQIILEILATCQEADTIKTGITNMRQGLIFLLSSRI